MSYGCLAIPCVNGLQSYAFLMINVLTGLLVHNLKAMAIVIIWIGLSFLVALTGKDKDIGYWGVFFLSLLLSPLIGLIIGLVSSQAIPKQSFKCNACGFNLNGMPDICKNCNAKMTYPLSVYENVKYTCDTCKKTFLGRKENCPHCKIGITY